MSDKPTTGKWTVQYVQELSQSLDAQKVGWRQAVADAHNAAGKGEGGQMSDKPTGEWTAESVWELMGQAAIDNRSLVKVANAHNAALADDYAKSEEPRCDFVSHLELEQQLAAEREKSNRLQNGWTYAEEKLAAEQQRANDSIEENVRLMNRLAAEREKVLMLMEDIDILESYPDDLPEKSQGHRYWGRMSWLYPGDIVCNISGKSAEVIKAALAKVKEG